MNLIEAHIDKLTHSLVRGGVNETLHTLVLRLTETESICSLVGGVNQSVENVVFVLSTGILSPLANHFLEDAVHFYTCSVPLPVTHTHTHTHTTHTHTQREREKQKEREEGRKEVTGNQRHT